MTVAVRRRPPVARELGVLRADDPRDDPDDEGAFLAVDRGRFDVVEDELADFFAEVVVAMRRSQIG